MSAARQDQLHTFQLANPTPLGRDHVNRWELWIGKLVGRSRARRWKVVASCLLLSGQTAIAEDSSACCADLDARIAELEAAAAAKGNSKTALTLYGHVNQAVMAWNDGYERNAYFVTNDASRTRIGLRGKSEINADLSAIFLLELGIRSANSKRSDQTEITSGMHSRRAWWGAASKRLGTVQIGRVVTSLEEITEANLADTRRGAKYSDVEDSGLGLRLRSETTPALSDVTWRRLLKHTGNQPGEGDAQMGIRYITPTISGFFASLAWGADDAWDASIQYLGDISDFTVEGRIGYGQSKDAGDEVSIQCVATNVPRAPSDAECEMLGGSLSIMHRQTGLYGNVAGGWFEDHTASYASVFAGIEAQSESTFFALEAGIQRPWLDMGATTLFGQYYRMDGGANARLAVPASDAINSIGVDAGIASSTVTSWSVGITQDIEAANTKLYVFYRQYSADVTLAGSGIEQVSEPLENLDIVMSGAIVRF
ncbi:porin [Hyphomicrobium sp.]|uniref:porin n=1 Tax=Hyphomicrobium sp. TaxID=82 RepID=UPI002E31EA75|nr:porin [Hyphomicrobium sp.]HEX2841339.1 porin [Hyphomicrobium sp.]